MNFMYSFLSVLDLCCCVWIFFSYSEWACSLVVVHGLLSVLAYLVEHGCQVHGLLSLQHTCSGVAALDLGSVVVGYELGCPAARGISLDQESNPCSLHWQMDSEPVHHQGSPPYQTFVLLRLSIDWMRLTLSGEGHLLYLICGFKY